MSNGTEPQLAEAAPKGRFDGNLDRLESLVNRAETAAARLESRVVLLRGPLDGQGEDTAPAPSNGLLSKFENEMTRLQAALDAIDNHLSDLGDLL